MMMSRKKRNKCDLCSNSLGTCDPSPMALERIHAMQAENAQSKGGRRRKNSALSIVSGCDWYINSAEHGYCFWNYAKELDEPIPDKEICQLPCITQNQLRETYNAAINKLRENKDDPVIKEFIETIIDFSANRRYDDDFLMEDAKTTVNQMPTLPKEARGEDGEPEAEVLDEIDNLKKGKVKGKRGRKKSKTGMPLHRDGKKTDLYGLYSDPEKQKEQQEKYAKSKKNKN